MSRLTNRKRKASYNLEDIKQCIRNNRYRIPSPRTRKNIYNKLGFVQEEVTNIILELKKDDFVESMASYYKKEIWQDNYAPVTQHGKLYIKIRLDDQGCVIISFDKYEDLDDEFRKL